MKVALCEDNQHERDYTKYMIYRFRPNWHIIEYKSGEDLIDAYENGKFYDIIFLDIYMDQLNGMDTAKLLRTKGINTAIVFLTSSADFAIESYEVRALSYLLKPITFEKFQELLEILEQ